MNKEIYFLLDILFSNKEEIEVWLTGYNTQFNMSPLRMMEMGRQEEVVSLLNFAVWGPY